MESNAKTRRSEKNQVAGLITECLIPSINFCPHLMKVLNEPRLMMVFEGVLLC